jgi:uncharacterized cupin superfamily protein
MSLLRPAAVVRSTAVSLVREPVPAAQVLFGSPEVALRELCTMDGLEVGLWEMTAGLTTDVEIDEIFVVLNGRARIQFTNITAAPIDVAAGDVVLLPRGAQTVWAVSETIRKVYLAIPGAGSR